ncbi:MAG: glycosyltransferase family 1 protein [Terriglobia bacterium]
MILGVNGIRLVSHRSGVARCIEAFLHRMGEFDHPFREVRVYTPKPIPAEVPLPPWVKNVVLPTSLPLGLWEQVTMMRAHGDKDVLFCPSYVLPLMARCPTVLAHHGSYEGYPQAFSWWVLNKARLAYTLSAQRATVVATVSEFSKRDMVHFYGMKPERIHVVPEGVDTSNFRPIDDPARLAQWRVGAFGSDRPFIAYVGKPTERRNLSALIRAFGRLRREQGIPHELVIAGADLPGASPFREVIRSEGLDDHVFVRGYVSHEEMPLLYNAAALMVYPSSYEGFGMPVLEAMACGTPVIALNNTAFPEFAGGVARLLDNPQIETLQKGIFEVLNDDAARKQMSREGPIRAAAYDWSVVTKRYLDLIIPLANGRKPE